MPNVTHRGEAEPAAAGDITRLLNAWRRGEPGALDELIPLVYGELHAMARRYLRGERSDHTLQPTAIVHEAYIRLLGRQRSNWQNRAHFFGVAAQSMRRILVEHARRRNAQKRGGQGTRYFLDTVAVAVPRSVDVIAVDDALCGLTELDPQQGQIVELRFFGGLTEPETARVLGISPTTVRRKWLLAKAYLQRELAREGR